MLRHCHAALLDFAIDITMTLFYAISATPAAPLLRAPAATLALCHDFSLPHAAETYTVSATARHAICQRDIARAILLRVMLIYATLAYAISIAHYYADYHTIDAFSCRRLPISFRYATPRFAATIIFAC